MKSENIGNIVAAIAKCSVAIGAVSKDGYNKAQGYAFVGDEHIMGKAQRALAEHGLAIAPVEMKSVSVPSIKGTQNVCTVSVTWLVSHESGEWLTIQTIGEGADSADKGAYKAMTGARKYAFRLLFSIPTGDDAERDETPAQAPVQRATTTAPANPVDAEKEERRGILRHVLATGLNITQENQLLFRDTPIENLREFQKEFRGQLENLNVAPGVAFSAAAKYLTGAK